MEGEETMAKLTAVMMGGEAMRYGWAASYKGSGGSVLSGETTQAQKGGAMVQKQ
jgi:hypothetical protein